MSTVKTQQELLAEIEHLRQRLEESQETIEAIRSGRVDALVIQNGDGHQLYALRSADHTYRLFIEKMKEGAVTIDHSGTILYANSQFAALVGVAQDLVLGTSFISYIPATYHERFRELVRQGWNSDSKGELFVKDGRNKTVPCLLSFSSLELDQGTTLSIIVTDLTIQKETEAQLLLKNQLLDESRRQANKMNEELEDIVVERTRDLYLSREHFKFLADNIPVIVWTADGSGKTVYFNKQWYEYTGMSVDESKDEGYRNVIHPDDLASLNDAWGIAIRSRKPFQFEYRVCRRSDSTYRWHIVKGEPFTDDNSQVIAWFGTATDIEDQKRELEKKDEFMSTASHELKTPLSSVKGYVQLIGRQQDLSPTVDRYLDKANESINKLQHLIDNLLDVTRISAGKLKFSLHVFDLAPLIASCVEDCRHLYGTFRIDSNVQPGLYVSGNPERLEQVLINLISNAVKYSPEKREIIISAVEKNQKVIVTVRDFGMGLSEEQQTKVFERFYRADSNSYSGGLGIGLYISSEIIREHNGRMEVKSKLKEGSEFSFTLDLVTTPVLSR